MVHECKNESPWGKRQGRFVMTLFIGKSWWGGDKVYIMHYMPSYLGLVYAAKKKTKTKTIKNKDWARSSVYTLQG